MAEPFRYLLRVRYGECDAQMIVYNARWGDYVDIATTEFTRAVFGTVDPSATSTHRKPPNAPRRYALPSCMTGVARGDCP